MPGTTYHRSATIRWVRGAEPVTSGLGGPVAEGRSAECLAGYAAGPAILRRRAGSGQVARTWPPPIRLVVHC